jgi:hypothetical protein
MSKAMAPLCSGGSKITDFMAEHVFNKGDIIVMVSAQPGVVGTTDTIEIRQLD